MVGDGGRWRRMVIRVVVVGGNRDILVFYLEITFPSHGNVEFPHEEEGIISVFFPSKKYNILEKFSQTLYQMWESKIIMLHSRAYFYMLPYQTPLKGLFGSLYLV